MRKFILNVTIFIFLSSSFFVVTAATANSVDYICPPNSYLKDGLCYCNEGVWNKEQTKCITYNQACQNEYGPHAYGDANYCYCEDGYVWNTGKTKCITPIEWCFSIYNDEHMEAYKEGDGYKCKCIDGYVWFDELEKCVTSNEWCFSIYNDEHMEAYKEGDEYKCKCINGYVWNKEQTKCITPNEWCFDMYNDEHITARKEGDSCHLYCHCVEGYVWHDESNKCITHTENCRLTYGEHVIGRDDEKCWSYCDCEEGYAWNLSKSQCIPKFKAFIEYFTHFNLLAFILGLTPILIWFLVIKLVIKFVFKTKLSIKKSLIFFGLGILITPLAWHGDNLYLKLLRVDLNVSFSSSNIILVYGGIAIIEELAKFFSAFFILKRNKHFDEAIDAMIYLIVLALGFALAENILAANQEIVEGGILLPVLQTMSLRFIGANLLHALSSGIIGFFWTLKLVTGKKKYLGIGLILGILLHGVFNIAIINLGGDLIYLVSLILFLIGIFFSFTIKKFLSKLNFHRFQ